MVANDGNEALTLLKEGTTDHRVDLVLSDILMPHMDGYELIAEIRLLYPHIKLQLASGLDGDHPARSQENGVHGSVLRKPYSSNELLTRIRDLLDETDGGDRKL